MAKQNMKYDTNLNIDYQELEERFRQFLDKYECWNRATNGILKLFEKDFKKNTRTFQRWRRNLLLGNRMFEDTNAKYRTFLGIQGCYFCEVKKELVVHHLDRNRDNNQEGNLLVLCPKCHHRLHQLYDKITIDKKTYSPKCYMLNELKGGNEDGNTENKRNA